MVLTVVIVEALVKREEWMGLGTPTEIDLLRRTAALVLNTETRAEKVKGMVGAITIRVRGLTNATWITGRTEGVKWAAAGVVAAQQTLLTDTDEQNQEIEVVVVRLEAE
jgi:hypothetical protein